MFRIMPIKIPLPLAILEMARLMIIIMMLQVDRGEFHNP